MFVIHWFPANVEYPSSIETLLEGLILKYIKWTELNVTRPFYQTRGKPAETQISLEAALLQNPWPEAHLVKLPRERRKFGSNTLRQSRVVLQFKLLPPGSLWRAGNSFLPQVQHEIVLYF